MHHTSPMIGTSQPTMWKYRAATQSKGRKITTCSTVLPCTRNARSTSATPLIAGGGRLLRRRNNLPPPAMIGVAEVERALRVQGNTVEQVVIFLPLLWVAALYFHMVGWLVPIIGLVWCIGRIVFALGYM